MKIKEKMPGMAHLKKVASIAQSETQAQQLCFFQFVIQLWWERPKINKKVPYFHNVETNKFWILHDSLSEIGIFATNVKFLHLLTIFLFNTVG